MKYLREKYRNISIWLSLAILVTAFLIGSGQERRGVYVPAVFLMAALMYGIGAVCEWLLNRRVACAFQAALTVCMAAGAILALLQSGGVI